MVSLIEMKGIIRINLPANPLPQRQPPLPIGRWKIGQMPRLQSYLPVRSTTTNKFTPQLQPARTASKTIYSYPSCHYISRTLGLNGSWRKLSNRISLWRKKSVKTRKNGSLARLSRSDSLTTSHAGSYPSERISSGEISVRTRTNFNASPAVLIVTNPFKSFSPING